jgi:hypothetical protein
MGERLFDGVEEIEELDDCLGRFVLEEELFGLDVSLRELLMNEKRITR